jgi:hypothetical protein
MASFCFNASDGTTAPAAVSRGALQPCGNGSGALSRADPRPLQPVRTEPDFTAQAEIFVARDATPRTLHAEERSLCRPH